tara:strand:- start:1060 stop:1530 length:471 start_codon:yes stop_codon:yes gene_type:complete
VGSFFGEILAELLTWYLDIKFWFKKKKRRKFEKAYNLPKRPMIYPSTKIYLVILGIGMVSVVFFMFFVYPDIKESRTKEKLTEISQILEKEKVVLGSYPKELKLIIRNNPLRKSITMDYWENEFQYELYNDGESYILFSSGKDRNPNTDDDIVIKN